MYSLPLLPESFTHKQKKNLWTNVTKNRTRWKAASVSSLRLKCIVGDAVKPVMVWGSGGSPKKRTSQTDNDTMSLGCSRLSWQAPFQRCIKKWKYFPRLHRFSVSLSGETGRQLWAEPAVSLCRSGVFISATSAAMHLRVFPTQRWPTAIYLSLKTKTVFHSNVQPIYQSHTQQMASCASNHPGGLRSETVSH